MKSVHIDERAGALDERPAADRSDPWGMLVLLLLIAVLNYVDRLLPGVLAEPIRKDLGLSDTALGVINGFGFLLVYAVAGIPISRLADRGHQRAVIVCSLGLWSAMTALGSIARMGWQFGATRFGVALGEAGSTPASHALISRRFSEERRARALSILGLGAALGPMLGLMLGGWLGGLLGWRQTFVVMGIAGLVLLVPAWFALGKGEAADRVSAITGRGRWTDLFRTRSGALTVIGAALVATGGYATVAFNAAFLMRVHEMSVAQTGIRLGLAQGVAGVTVILLTGWLADLLGRSDPRATLHVLAGTMLLAVPVLIVAYLADSDAIAVVGLAVGAGCMNSYVGLSVVALYRLVPPEVRARTSATLLFSTAMLGGAGPLLVGMASDALARGFGQQSLRYAMLLVPLFSAMGALSYVLAAGFYRADMIRIGQAEA